MILKDRGPDERMVMEYRSERSEWRLQCDGEEELVDLDMLNVRLRCRSVADHASGGLDGLGVPAAAGMDVPQLLQKLLAGIDPDWEKKLPEVRLAPLNGQLYHHPIRRKGYPCIHPLHEPALGCALLAHSGRDHAREEPLRGAQHGFGADR